MLDFLHFCIIYIFCICCLLFSSSCLLYFAFFVEHRWVKEMGKTGGVGSGQMQKGETFGEMQKKLLRHGT